MTALLVCVFVLGYLLIALEHPLKINKAATALLLGVVIWTLYVLGGAGPVDHKHEQLLELTGETAGLLFFLMGAMTIVELVDANAGFVPITRRIGGGSPVRMLWIIGLLAFFMSSVLDNLTTTIVMVSVLKKAITDRAARWPFVGLVVIAANAGGAWTAIGDVTTTMLWMQGKFSPWAVMLELFVPSLICLLVPLAVLSFQFRGQSLPPVPLAQAPNASSAGHGSSNGHARLFLGLGIAGLISVPVFKTWTHLPPYMGMLLSLAALWIVSEVLHRHGDPARENGVVAVLQRIDLPSILFFLGILLAVGGLGADGVLQALAAGLDAAVGSNIHVVAVLVGLLSAIVDNVPLVAAGIDMYTFPSGDPFWMLLAYCAGTGGSCLIIGSAAGVAAMGLDQVDFFWYLRRSAPLALLGYLAGVAWLMLIT